MAIDVLKLRAGFSALGRHALAWAKAGITLGAWSFGIAAVIYLVRLPFYDDDPQAYVRYVVGLLAVTMASALVLMAGFWLFEKSRIFRVIFVGLLVLSGLATCFSSSRCVESRYITCD